MFYLIINNELEVYLELSGVSDHLPSVAFDIDVSWRMPFQKVNIQILECWFECSSIDTFLLDLKTLISLESGEATLLDLSHRPVICLVKSGNELITKISAQDTAELGQTQLTVYGYSAELSELTAKLSAFEKWW